MLVFIFHKELRCACYCKLKKILTLMYSKGSFGGFVARLIEIQEIQCQMLEGGMKE